jgi:hypothetical protein
MNPARNAQDDFAKILAFAASAGETLTEREALDVIKAIARAHVRPSTVNAALARHVRRIVSIVTGSPRARALVEAAGRE